LLILFEEFINAKGVQVAANGREVFLLLQPIKLPREGNCRKFQYTACVRVDFSPDEHVLKLVK